MASEVHVPGSTGLNLYAAVRNTAAQVFRPASSAFEAFNAVNYANYATAIALTEQDDTGIYIGNFPAAIVTEGVYDIDVRRRIGGSPDISDPVYAAGSIDWTGSAVRGALTDEDIEFGANAALINYDSQNGVAYQSSLLDVTSSLGTLTATITTVNSKLGAFSGSGTNTLFGFLRALFRKDATLTPSDVGGTFDNTTDSLEAIRDRGDAAWTGGGGGGGGNQLE